MKPRTRFFRGLAMLGVLGVVLSACKEELVLPPAEPTITVTPAGPIELRVGESVTLVATVTNVGEDKSVTYTSSNQSVATVNAQGEVTAVSAGTATVTVRSNANTSLQAAVQIRVIEDILPPTEEPKVTLESVTQTATNFPVNPANIFGQIDVTAEVQRGPADSLVFSLIREDGQKIKIENCSQTFGSATAAAKITAKDLRLAPNQTDVVCSILTDSFKEENGVGIPLYPNGETRFVIELKQGDAVIASATSGVHVFNNENKVKVTLESSASASNPDTRLLWHGGPGKLTAKAIPVIFDGPQVARVIFHYAGKSLTKKVDEAPFEYAFRGDLELANVTDPDFVIEVSTVLENGQPGPSSESDDWLPPFRYDSEAPDAGTFFLAEQNLAFPSQRLCCSNNWVGSAYQFSAGHSGSNDAGVGIAQTTYHVGPASDDDEDIAELPAVTTGAELDETSNTDSLTVVVKVVDHLGNVTVQRLSPNPTNPKTTIGVDKTAPTASFAATSVADMTIFTAAPGVADNFVVQFSDAATGGAKPSEFSETPVLARIRRIFPGLTADDQCLPPGSFSTATGCRLSGSTGTTPVTGTTPLPVTQGYFIYEATVVDQAGNLSHPTTAPLSRIVLIDQERPSASNIAIPAALTGGALTTFTAQAQDNLNLWRGDFRFNFDGVILPFTERQVFNDRFVSSIGALVTTANASVTLPFVRALEQVDTANAPTGVLAAADTVHLLVEDAAGNSVLQGNAFAANTVPEGESFRTRDVQTFQIATPDTAVNLWNGTDEQPPNSVTSVEITATATGPSGTFANPFTVVYFYRRDGGQNELIGTANNPVVTDNGMDRTWTWSITLNGAGLDAQSGVPIFAVGVHSSGDALQAADNTNIDIVDGD